MNKNDRLLGLICTLAVLLCSGNASGQDSKSLALLAPASDKIVRLAVVNTPADSDLLASLLPDFEQQSGMVVQIYSGNDVYDKARAGQADLVISHYGKDPVEAFVMEGYGSWPRIVFSNQAVLIGHKSDPAKVREVKTVAEAMRRIAESRAPFVANSSESVSYLTEVALASIGEPDPVGWYLDSGLANGQAVMAAEKSKGYVIWGAIPFLRFLQKHSGSEMEILVAEDPALQRIMAATVVNPDKVPGVNARGAAALVDYLLTPRVQARIAAYRTPGSDAQLWWPAGRNN